ncbi:hypothetical protein POJ06DRAFT_250603 [Lipomyces tetrasporus]|uniref:U6 small nuclear RNA (adenine-(43)-N(6))-methyltransferase n=1 Tax=Lipomyces tetrasporus TaxID=54092 RepID=A0AAD7QTT2_9ASCO|nr:uncharacterized protein POJ06DRAFT_250603 [Lipomyces tetrasporus]KAJ8101148.1 hypothetical protein POJ06DRAFT_250603 [Lipomyces tetrasporus]
MHVRNPYAHNPPDFRALAESYSKLAKFLHDDMTVDFTDPEAVCALTEALLHKDFDIDVELLPDRLCPRVANRLNYILWLQDLLDSDSFDSNDTNSSKPIWGLDIGTGTSCIYPLLGCRLRRNWHFIATDVDDVAVSTAAKLVSRNNLMEQISVFKADPGNSLFGPHACGDSHTSQHLHFTMCNPPFYSSSADYNASQALKVTPARSFTSAAPEEMITPGGEVAFVTRMINESIEMLRNDVNTGSTWYTSMLGKLDSLKDVVNSLRKRGISNYAVAEFIQGQFTRRWAVAWRFDGRRPLPDITRPLDPLPSTAIRGLLPPATGWILDLSHTHGANDDRLLDKVLSIMKDEFGDFMKLERLSKLNCETTHYITGYSQQGNVWSRNFRRNKKRKIEEHSDHVEGSRISESTGFGFRIFVEQYTSNTDIPQCSVHWSYGSDPIVFESFCGMLKDRIQRIVSK